MFACATTVQFVPHFSNCLELEPFKWYGWQLKSNRSICLFSVCSVPPAIENGKYSPEGPHLAGHSIVFSCFNGYVLSGIESHTCQTNGDWITSKFPKCLGNSIMQVFLLIWWLNLKIAFATPLKFVRVIFKSNCHLGSKGLRITIRKPWLPSHAIKLKHCFSHFIAFA